MTAAMTPLPVFGVPVQSKTMSGQDSLLSIVQMPAASRSERWRSARLAPTRRFSPRRFWRCRTKTSPTGLTNGARAVKCGDRRISDGRPMSMTTIGIIGGGQLGRMLAKAAAARLNSHHHSRAAADCPAAQVCQPADRRL